MPRRNPEVERLERENALLRREMESMRRDPGDLPVSGCGDNSCEVRTPSGMATNGGCSCDEREVRRALRYYKRLARWLASGCKTPADVLAVLRNFTASEADRKMHSACVAAVDALMMGDLRGPTNEQIRAAINLGDSAYARGVEEGERRAKAKAEGLVERWRDAAENANEKAHAYKASGDEIGVVRFSAHCRALEMCAGDIRAAFVLTDGQPPTGGEPAPYEHPAVRAAERAPVVPGQPSAGERDAVEAGKAGPFIPHEQAMAGVCERAHADGIVEGLRRALVVAESVEPDGYDAEECHDLIVHGIKRAISGATTAGESTNSAGSATGTAPSEPSSRAAAVAPDDGGVRIEKRGDEEYLVGAPKTPNRCCATGFDPRMFICTYHHDGQHIATYPSGGAELICERWPISRAMEAP